MLSPDLFQLERASAPRRLESQRDTTQTFVRLAAVHWGDESLAAPASDSLKQARAGHGLTASVAALARRLSMFRRGA